MSEPKRVNMFNVNPLVIEVEEVLKRGLNNILINFMDRYELLENTHKQIMSLPSIRQELNKNKCETDSEYDIDDYSANYKNNMYDRSTLDLLDYRLDKLEKKYDTMIPVLDKILSKIINLDEEIKSIKSSECNKALSLSRVKNEKENIKINFEETIEEESDYEDINPALITCSTIKFDKEPVKTTLGPVANEIPSSEDVVCLEEDDELSVGEELGEHEESVEEQPEDNEEGESEEVEEVNEEDIVEEVSEVKVEANLPADVEEECEEVEEDDVEANVEAETASSPVDNLTDDLETKSEVNAEAVEADDELVDEKSIETETKSDVEEDNENKEEEEEEQLEVEKQPSEEDDNEELFEIEIDDKTYCTNDDQNGFIWELTEDGEQGEKIGYLKDGDAYFYEDEN